MGFTKITVSENVQAMRDEENKKISAFVKSAGKKSVEELTDEEKQQLQNKLVQHHPTVLLSIQLTTKG